MRNPGLIALVLASTSVEVAAGQVLLDTLSIVDEQSYWAGNGNAVSGGAVFGGIYDLQVADDFYVAPWGARISRIVKDELTYFGGTPHDGILVEFFRDLGGYPSEDPVASNLATGAEISASSWTDTVFGLNGRRYTIDTWDWDLVLPTGHYFISVVPVDTSGDGDWYYTPRGDVQYGADAYLRDGGRDHARDGWYFGGYAGGHGFDDFVSAGYLGYGVGDSSIRIEAWIPEPASLALLALGVVVSRRR